MLGLKSVISVIDNSGAVLAEVINVLKAGSARGSAGIGDEVVVVVNKARAIPNVVASGPTASSQASTAKVRRGDIRHAVIVRTKKETRRPDGRYVRFDDNACVLLNNKGDPAGTRISGVVAAELRNTKFAKVAAMAPRLI